MSTVDSTADRPSLINLVDTGANKYLTVFKDDFVKLYDTKCSISGTAGKEGGTVGLLKENVFGIKYGVLFNLPKPIGRIIPYLGKGNLRKNGWDLSMSDMSGTLFHRESGMSCTVRYDSTIELPIMDNSPFSSQCYVSNDNSDTHMNIIIDTQQTSAERDCCIDMTAVDGDVFLSKLQLHRRLGHWSVCPVDCRECAMSKGNRASHAKIRESRQDYKPLQTLGMDFAGAISPESIRNCNYCLVVICDCIKKVFVRPLRYKNQVVEALKETVEKIRQDYSVSMDEKVVHFLRRDNEPVLDSTVMTNTLRSLRVSDAPGVPWNPEQNGTAERYIRSLFGSVRASLVDVDLRLWCYGCEYSADCWDRIPHNYAKAPQYNGKTPIQICEERSGETAASRALACSGALAV